MRLHRCRGKCWSSLQHRRRWCVCHALGSHPHRHLEIRQEQHPSRHPKRYPGSRFLGNPCFSMVKPIVQYRSFLQGPQSYAFRHPFLEIEPTYPLVVINITICGDWAGADFNNGNNGGTCADAVGNSTNYDGTCYLSRFLGRGSYSPHSSGTDLCQLHFRLPAGLSCIWY